MSKKIDERALMDRLAYPSEISRTSPEFASLEVHCKGDAEQLRELLAATPFTLESDRILLSCTDKRSCEWYKDGTKLPFDGYLLAGISVLVRYGDHVGSFGLSGYGNEWRNLIGTAEFLGAVKHPADISFATTSSGYRTTVNGGVLGHGEGELLRFGLKRSSTRTETADDLSWPSKYFTIRMVPSLGDISEPLSFLEIFALDGGTLIESESFVGDGYVEVSPSVFGCDLIISEILGATYRRGILHFDPGGYAFTAVHQSSR